MAMGDGSAIEMHAADRAKQSWTQLATTAEVGDTVLRFTEATNWEVGDLIAIASSDFEHDHHETRVITDVRNNGRVIEIDSPLDHRHYGEIETYDNGKRGTAFQSWDVDLRAEVGLLSRNITVTGDEDAQDDLFGGHTMVMEGAEMRIDGVEFTKMGQAAILGRYATHWHMLDDASGQYIQNASYHQTFNKGMTIHGTDNVEVHNNVLFDHIGHGVFFEDGSETGVRVTDNLVFGTKKATNATETIPTDQDEVSSFWVEHPNNIFIGNHAAGSEEHGFRFFPNDAPHGASTGQDVPGDFGDLVFRDNTVHSMMNGVFFGGRIDAGTLEIDGPGRQANDAELLLEDTTVYKTIHKRRGGVWAEADNTHIVNLMAVDNGGAVTITRDGYIQDSLIVAESRGNEQDLNFRRAEDQRGLRIYVTADGAVEDVHFEGFNETGEIAFEHSVSNQPNSYAAGLTFADTPDAFRFKWTEGIGQSSTLLDVDGSLTGTPNTLLLPTRSVPGASPQDQFNGFDVPSGNSQTMDELIDDLVKWR
ncbi:MAG: right-handed parallel beta-helix repeat-containing protein, partial [Pseudomonadota bacterium]